MSVISVFIPQTIYKTNSKFSGEIKVIDHAFSRRLVVGGLTQSGGILKTIYGKTLDKLRSKYQVASIENILILGLGAGTVVEVINKQYPDAKIVSVEIDPVMVEVGKKYFQLSKAKNLEIIIDDAIMHMNKSSNKKFDLIFIDLYKGFFIEKNIKNVNFLQKTNQKLAKNGIVIFNVVSSQNKHSEASVFLDNLHRIFDDNFYERILSNIIFYSKKSFPKRR